MAEKRRESYEIYWTRDESVLHNSDYDGAVESFAPGVDQPGNKRPIQKMKPQRMREAAGEGRMRGQDGSLIKRTKRRENSMQETKTPTTAEAVRVKDKPSLKDLRPEDKKRIANLIRELAKVGEEKEVIVQQLNVERRTYEDKVTKLQEQMAAIMQERELTQKQYLECQKLLAEYQSQLATEQEKLAASFHLPSSPHKHNPAPLTVTKAKPDFVPTAKNRLFTHSGVPHQGVPSVANHQQPTYQNATQNLVNEHSSAPHQNRYQYPSTHHGEPNLKSMHPPPSVQQSNMGAYNARSDWNQPPGTQQHHPPITQPPSTQPSHPPGSDFEFNPMLASTHRPAAQGRGNGNDRSWMAQKSDSARNSEPTMYVSYGNTANPGGYVLQPSLNPEQGIRLPQMDPSHRYPSDSQETLSSRARSGDFRPLQPELETDYESQGSNSPEHMGSLWNHHQDYAHRAGPQAGPRFPASFQGDTGHTNVNLQGPLDQAGVQHASAQQSGYRTSPEHRRAVLERQRHQLREEQAWLQQKLRDQEEMLSQKQSQLQQHRLHQLEREWQKDHRDLQLEQEWQRNHNDYIPPTSNPNMNSMDHDWEEPNIFKGRRYKAASGSENDEDDIVISTNFPPESFTNLSQPMHDMTNSMKGLNLEQSTRHTSHVRGPGIATGDKSQGRKRRDGESFQGYASLYPQARARPKIQGSTSSCSPSTSDSTNSQPALVDRSTSPLFRDQGTAVPDRASVGATSSGRGRVSLSPGKVNVTPAPQGNRSRSYTSLRQDQRLPERRAMSLPRSPRQLSGNTGARKSNVTHLSDLIAQMESPPPPGSTHSMRPGNTSHDTSTARQGYRTTPDLFPDDATDTETEVQESRILEDVFFL